VIARTLVTGALLSAALLPAQSFDGAPAKKSYVTYTAESQMVPAGKKAVLELRFHVQPGFHVNSHMPKSEFLIPTRLEFQAAAGVKADSPEYPVGKSYSFSFSPQEKLDVYSEEFTVKLPITATAGQHEIDGVLKYQACDTAACYPPKSLPLQVLFTAR